MTHVWHVYVTHSHLSTNMTHDPLTHYLLCFVMVLFARGPSRLVQCSLLTLHHLWYVSFAVDMIVVYKSIFYRQVVLVELYVRIFC